MFQDGYPNLLGPIVLVLWAFVTLFLVRSWGVTRGSIWSLLGAAMFLPEGVGFDPPLFPRFGKADLPGLYLAVAVFIFGHQTLRARRPGTGVEAFLIVTLLAASMSPIWNTDPIRMGAVFVPGHSPVDALSSLIGVSAKIVVPFMLGSRIIRTPAAGRELLVALALGAAFYSILALVEIRLSPQLHRWTYGFHQMDFSMTLRMGGYRPMIYMKSGLMVGLFILCGTLAAGASSRLRETRKTLYRTLTAWLAISLVLCKSLGAIVYGVALIPATLVFRPRHMMMLAVTIAAITLTYPILRTADLVPVDQLVDWFARNVEEERAESLKFRFEQEYILLGRAMERPWLGWGLFGRNHLHSVTTGEMTTITDGYWVIVLGMSGIIGFLGQFGLLTFPVFAASRALRRMRMSSDRILLSALALINAILALDLIPNAFPSPFQWFLCGGLLGLSEWRAPTRSAAHGSPPETAPAKSIPPLPPSHSVASLAGGLLRAPKSAPPAGTAASKKRSTKAPRTETHATSSQKRWDE